MKEPSRLQYMRQYFFVYFLVLISCQVEKNDSAESSILLNENHEEIDSLNLNDTSLTRSADLHAVKDPNFALIMPDTALIKAEILKQGGNKLYQYFTLYYNLGSEKEIIRYYTLEEKHPCEFRQSFKYGIEYYGDECGIGHGKFVVKIPYMSIPQIKRIIALLYENEYNNWSKDSLSYTDSPNGIGGAGCEFSYQPKDEKIVITIFCSD